jgi:tetratricopeptide (TPR) repeat protein
MPAPLLFSILETPAHRDHAALYRRLGIRERKLGSMRKAIAALREQVPDFVVAEFLYGYGNNYAGVNISNLDVFLYSLQKYSSATRIIVLVAPAELPFVDKLAALFPLHAVLPLPVDEQALERALTQQANVDAE